MFILQDVPQGKPGYRRLDFCLYMQHNNIDVGFMNDIRLTANECEMAKRKLKGLFVEETHISASSVEDPGTPGGKVGGQLVIIRGAWRTAVCNTVTDRAGLGGLLMVYLKTKSSTIAIANTYWPTLPTTDKEISNALHNKYVR